MRAVLDAVFAPTLAVSAFDPTSVPALLSEIAEGKRAPSSGVAAYLCRSFTCEAPLEAPAALTEALTRSRLVRSDRP